MSGQKGLKFWFDRWIAPKFLLRFLEVVLLGVAMECLLGDEDLWSPVLEFRLKSAITFDPTVGSHSEFYRGFCPSGSYVMAIRWRGCLVARTWVSAQKGHNFWSYRWIALKRLQGFPEAVFIGIAMEWLLEDEDVWSTALEYRLKSGITFDPTVGSRLNFYRGCFPRGSYGIATRWRGCLVGRTWVSAQERHNFWSYHWIALKHLQGFPDAVFIGVAIEWLLGDEHVWSVEPEYRLKRAITIDPTVWSRLKVYRGCFTWGSYGMATGWWGCLVART
jgi:hypothetical protein